jgi:hypothetical protein
MTFVIELALPFLFFAPRRPRMLAAAGTLGLELLIFATGNYNFFNLLTIALCLFLFEDAQLRRLIPSRWSRSKSQRHATIGRRTPVAATILGGVILLSGTYHLARPFLTDAMPAWAHRTAAAIDPLRLTNGYGLFAVMTTKRTEIIVEGSHDGRSWTEYPFRYKPGDVGRAPRWNVPHQPRLDWQMWFAALSTAGWHPWFHNFLKRLLENEPKVTALLETNPFADNAPRYVRATLYDYRFSTPEQRNATGAWWSRTIEGLYHPPMQRR